MVLKNNFSFTIPGRLPGTNEVTNANRYNRYAGASLKKKTTALCATYALLIPKITIPVNIGVNWIEPNMRRDVDNIAGGIKFILDGLVQAERIPNDSRKWVKTIFHSFSMIDPDNPRIEVMVSWH